DRMNISIALDHRFQMAPDGTVWSQTMFPYSFWTHYLEIFDEVHVIARVQPVALVSDDYHRVDGDKVKFIPLPYYLGPVQYLRQARRLNGTIARNLNQS